MNAPEIGSPEWARMVTASKVSAILGVSPWESPYSCWMAMAGRTPKREQTTAMARGNYLEPAILAWWRDQHPEIVRYEEQSWHELDGWAGATVDAAAWIDAPLDLTGKPHVIVEAKSAARMDEWGAPGTDEIPAYYLAQVYFQLALTGAVRAYVPVIGPFLEFTEYVVEADPGTQANIVARCADFHATITDGVPPELDDSVATYNTVRKAYDGIDSGSTAPISADDAAELIEAVAGAKAADARERLAKSTVLSQMGEAQFAVCGDVKVARRQANGFRMVAKSIEELTKESAA